MLGHIPGYCTPCPAGEHVVLPTRERSDARAEIEDSASKLPGCPIWLAANLGRTLLIVRVSAADG